MIVSIQPMVIKSVTTAVTAAVATAFKQMKEALQVVEMMHRNGDVIVLLQIRRNGLDIFISRMP